MTAFDFQQSSEAGRERMIRIPHARLTDITPAVGEPAEVTGRVAGEQITGVVYNAGVLVTNTYAILNVAKGQVIRASVRSVLTYNAGPVAEATWGVINIGDPVYYDAEQDVLNGVKLSTAPIQSDAATVNTKFGNVVMLQDESADDFPKAAADAGHTVTCAVCLGGDNI